MKRKASRLLWIGWLGWFFWAATPTPPPVQPITITWPIAYAAVQGQVLIQGRTAVPNFREAVLDFQPLPSTSTSSTPSPQGWISLATLKEPVVQGPLTTWDTQNLPSGPYLLRLRVFLRTGDVLVHQVMIWVGEGSPWVMVTPTPVPDTAFQPNGVTPSPPIGTPTPKPWPVAVEPWVPTPSPEADRGGVVWERSFFGGMVVGMGMVVLYLWVNRRRG